MGFTEDIAKLADQVHKRSTYISGEEATKMALILPFFSLLGFDVHNPSEVIPEFKADFAIKKAGQFEKVDYALAIDGEIVMLVEAKSIEQKPEVHDGQLTRYFNGVMTSKIAIVTNGTEFRFFTDIQNKNLMDKEPFFVFNILKYNAKDAENLKFFHRNYFNLRDISEIALEMMYVQNMTQLILKLLRSPSDDFVKLLIKELEESLPTYSKPRVTNKIIETFKPVIKKSIQASLSEILNSGLETPEYTKSSALKETVNDFTEEEKVIEVSEQDTKIPTVEELECFKQIEKIIAKSSSGIKIEYKKTSAYFSVNLVSTAKIPRWFIRLFIKPRTNFFVVKPKAADITLPSPDFSIEEIPYARNEILSKIMINFIEDLNKFQDLILECYEAEVLKDSM